VKIADRRIDRADRSRMPELIGRDGNPAVVPPRRELAYPALLAFGAVDAADYSVIAGQRTQALLLAALALLILGCLGFMVPVGLPALFAARLVIGVGSGGLWIAVTFATLERWPGQEYLCMSRIYAAYSVGGLIGPALGAIGGISGPFLAYLGLILATAPLATALGAPARRRRFTADRTMLRRSGFWLASTAILVAILGLGLAEGVLPLHRASRLQQPQIGALYVGVALVVAASSAAAGSIRPRQAVAASALLIVAGVTLAGVAATVPAFIAALLATGAGIGWARPARPVCSWMRCRWTGS
jgi:MFS family permease